MNRSTNNQIFKKEWTDRQIDKRSNKNGQIDKQTCGQINPILKHLSALLESFKNDQNLFDNLLCFYW